MWRWSPQRLSEEGWQRFRPAWTRPIRTRAEPGPAFPRDRELSRVRQILRSTTNLWRSKKMARFSTANDQSSGPFLRIQPFRARTEANEIAAIAAFHKYGL